MGKFIDLTGKRFGRLVVIERTENSSCGKVNWLCQCDCGQQGKVTCGDLRSGHTNSCGCFQREQTSKACLIHGHSKHQGSREYQSWASMKSRCLNPNYQTYTSYGGRGIKINPEWLSFETFLRDMGECPPGLTLERIKNDGNYEPNNCRWATRREQSRNKRTNKKLTAFGITKIQADWTRLLDVGRGAIPYWLKQGYDMEWILRHFQRVG